MAKLMRCEYCGLLQDEPKGVKSCARCGGELVPETRPKDTRAGYLFVQMELDQVAAPAGQNVERYLLVTLRTPKDVPLEEMPPGAQSRQPVNFTAVLDNSGSMAGEKIEYARQAVLQAVKYLHSGDIFSLVTFNNEVACPFEPMRVDPATSQAVADRLQTIRAGGSTYLDGGLEHGIRKALSNKMDINLVMLLSDGQTNVGEKDLEVIGMRALQARQQGVLVSALGIGLDYNEALLAEIASQGGGRFYHLEHPRQIPAYVAGELKDAVSPAARDLQIHLSLPAGATLVPLSATYPVQQVGNEAAVSVGDIPTDTEQEIPLRLALIGQAPGSRLSVEGRVTFRSPAGNALEAPLNRVTVRFLEGGRFSLREGVVAPVVERILEQMRAANVLGMARLMARQPDQAEQKGKGYLRSIHEYASLLGEQRAESEVQQISERFFQLNSDQSSSKQTVSAAFNVQRHGKTH